MSFDHIYMGGLGSGRDDLLNETLGEESMSNVQPGRRKRDAASESLDLRRICARFEDLGSGMWSIHVRPKQNRTVDRRAARPFGALVV